MVGQLALLVMGAFQAPEEPVVRDWVKAPVSATLQLASGRKLGIAKNVAIYAPDGQTCALTDIEVGEPVQVLLDFKGNARKIIRWNANGVVKAQVDLPMAFKGDWEIIDEDVLGTEELGKSLRFADDFEGDRQRQSVLVNPALFDAVSFSVIGAKAWPRSSATVAVLKGDQELWSSPLTTVLRTFTVDIPQKDSVAVNLTTKSFAGKLLCSNWTFLRYAWKTPKPVAPQAGQKIKTATFTWSDVEGADGYLVEVQRTGGAPLRSSAGAFSSTVITGDSITLDNLPPGTFRWRVHALKEGSIWSHAADWRTFEKS